MIQEQKIAVVVGPTASGKTALAIRLAHRFNGEIISADARQVYRGLDIGTGKVTEAEQEGIPHYLIDIASPEMVYTANDFVRDADKAIRDITNRHKLPIITGGTFFYIEALLGYKPLLEVPPNETLRATLASKDTSTLAETLRHKDPARAETIDSENRPRLIRALEIIAALGAVPRVESRIRYNTYTLGIDIPQEILDEKIHTRLLHHLEIGMIKEAETLHAHGLPFARMESLGLEYRYIAHYLQNMLTYDELVQTLETKIRQYAKRQRTWLKKMSDVHWIPYDAPSKAEALLEEFLGGR